MARPPKEGMDYFPHDVYAASDPKLESVIMLYGSKGYGFYFLHLEYIYRNSALEFDISDAETREVICQKLKITNEEYDQILQTCLKKKCFDKEYYEKTGALTSNGVKKRASVVIKKRENMKEYYEKVNDKKRSKIKALEDNNKNSSCVSDAETMEETHTETHKSKVKERKVKESKVKESKVKERKVNILIEEEESKKKVAELFKFFQNNICTIPTPFQDESISKYLDDGLHPDMILEVFKDSIGKKDKWKWIEKVLNNLFEQKIFTLERYNTEKALRKKQREEESKKNFKNNNISNMTNFEGRKYTKEETDGLYELED